MTTIAVTGVSGRVGQRLLRQLDSDPAVTHVLGLDARDPGFRPSKLRFYRVDLASADLKPVLEGADALVHLAYALSPPRDEALLARVNVAATARLLDAAGTAGVGTFVVASSAMVYGAWPDNPVPLTEDAPLRPPPEFLYAQHKAEVERLVAEWRAGHPGATAAVLRPAAALGSAGETWLGRLWKQLVPVRVRGAAPPVQYVHEDDLATAIALALQQRLDGVFNVAPDGWIPGDEARALAGTGWRLALPARVAGRVQEAAWSLHLSDVPPSGLAYLRHPWVVANDRLRAAGWEPTHTNQEAFVAGHQLPGWRAVFSRHRQHAALAGAGALVAGAGTAAVLLRRRARRRQA